MAFSSICTVHLISVPVRIPSMDALGKNVWTDYTLLWMRRRKKVTLNCHFLSIVLQEVSQSIPEGTQAHPEFQASPPFFTRGILLSCYSKHAQGFPTFAWSLRGVVFRWTEKAF